MPRGSYMGLLLFLPRQPQDERGPDDAHDAAVDQFDDGAPGSILAPPCPDNGSNAFGVFSDTIQWIRSIDAVRSDRLAVITSLRT